MIVEWTVRLAGEPSVLAAMEKAYPGPGLSVRKEDGFYQLRSPTFLAYTEDIEVSNAADALLRKLSAVLNIYGNYVGEVWAENAIWHDEQGRYGGMAASLRGRANFVDPNALAIACAFENGETHATRLQRLAHTNSSVEALLSLVSWDTPGWGGLYMQFELLREAYGGERGLLAATGLDSKLIDRFTETANSFRHASAKKPYRRRMDLAEARTLIRGLCRSWLDQM